MEMRLRTRQRAMRILLAALLDSDLTLQEMRELAISLSTSSTFLLEFSSNLRDFLHQLDHNFISKNTDFERTPNDEVAAYTNLQRRRISKRAALEIMTLHSDAVKGQTLDPNMTLRELVHFFWKASSPTERRAFVNALRSERGKDSYLEGIISRRREASS